MREFSMKKITGLLLTVLLALTINTTSYANDSSPLLKKIRALSQANWVLEKEEIHAVQSLQKFYSQRHYQPAWTESGTQPIDQLIQAVSLADEHGLNPSDYHFQALLNYRDKPDTPALDILATDAYLTLAAHIVGGRLKAETFEPDWTANRRERDLVTLLESSLQSQKILSSLQDLEPDAPAYNALKDGLKRFRNIEKNEGWKKIPDGKALKPGDSGPRVIALSQRLKAGGLLMPDYIPEDIFTTEHEIAVAAYQRLIGLEADGVAGVVTVSELNKPLSYRIGQIKANLERWRWLPEKLGERHIRVNIADYRLSAYDNGQMVGEHDVIVGRNYRKTPVFSDQISYLILNPWWETPDKLARLDKLPAFIKDPSSVKKLGFQVLDRQGNILDSDTINWADFNSKNFPFRLRQSPGEKNAMGKVKIMFPNKHNVYLHDTPTQQLFLRSDRAFSSGCIRVADVLGNV